MVKCREYGCDKGVVKLPDLVIIFCTHLALCKGVAMCNERCSPIIANLVGQKLRFTVLCARTNVWLVFIPC